MNQLKMKVIWKVQRDDGTVLARHDSKTKAMAAAVRFSADGCAYSVVEECCSGAIVSEQGLLLELTPR